ncbi:MAG: N-acetylglucosamine-6-phosphate deacetylase [Acidimicrobiales bacterium]
MTESQDPAAEPPSLQRATEAIRGDLADLDLLDVGELVVLLCSEVHRVPAAISAAAPAIADAVRHIVERLERGGRLVYVGAGTAGRLGILDAAEARPTFNVAPGTVIGLIAGGLDSETGRSEDEGAAEDDAPAGAAALRAIALGPDDVVVGLSASGRTPYVLGAVAEAKLVGALTVALSCNAGTALAGAADLAIEIEVGDEVIAGSTRMNAGTTQKAVLSLLSTAVMVKLGKTYGNLMVDLRPTNEKLRARAELIVSTITGSSRADVRRALASSNWEPKVAIMMLVGDFTAAGARSHLDHHRGRLRAALEALSDGSTSKVHGGLTSTSTRPSSTWTRLGVRAAIVDGDVVPGDVALAHGEIVAVGLSPRRAGSGLAIPGLVDAQVNGYAGVDLLGAEPAEIVKMGEALLADGVFAYQPTLITSDVGDLLAAIGRIAPILDSSQGPYAEALGIHLEGPFLSHARSGTHPVRHLRLPDLDLLGRLLDAGPIKTMTVAPELPGAIELIQQCVRRGIVVSLGHSASNASQASAAFAAGASAVTHLFNAMEPLSARSPGLAGVALTTPGVTLQLIGDGVHVSSEMLRLAFMSAPGRCTLVSDALAAAALGDGPILLGEVPVEVHGGVARRRDGTIAGSVKRLADGLANLVRIGISLDQAVEAVTRRPARMLGYSSHALLRPADPGDLVLVDEELAIVRVIKSGVEVGRP